MVQLVLYTRGVCPLCDQMAAAIDAADLSDVTLEKVDVDSDPALRARYGLSVPVLVIEGEVAFEGRLDPTVLRARVRAAAERGAGRG